MPAKKAIITGSGGLIGSACARLLHEEGWDVIGVDNDMRRQFFGEPGTTLPVVRELRAVCRDTGTSTWISGTARAFATS